MIFFVAKMRGAFALQKLLTHFFNKKYWQISDMNILNFNSMFTNDVVSFDNREGGGGGGGQMSKTEGEAKNHLRKFLDTLM